MNRLLAFFALLVLLGFGTWMILMPGGNDLSTSDSEGQAAASLEDPTDADLQASAANSREDEPTSDIQRTEFAAELGEIGKDPDTEYAQSVDHGIWVTVVDDETGKAIPHADVIFLDPRFQSHPDFNISYKLAPNSEGFYANSA